MAGVLPVDVALAVAQVGSEPLPIQGDKRTPKLATGLGPRLGEDPGANPMLNLVVPANARLRPPRPTRVEKPHVNGDLASWTPERAEAVCTAFSQDAARRGVRTLVLGFEGLVSYDPRATSEAYAWAAGTRSAPPGSYEFGGFVLHGTMRPLVERFGDRVEFLVFPETAQNAGQTESLPATCAGIWRNHSPDRRLIVIGHSMGGASASELSRILAADDTPVDLMVTFDPVPGTGTLRRWPTTARAINFRNFLGTVSGAQFEQRVFARHIHIPSQPQVVDAVMREIGAVLRTSEAR